MEGNNAAQRRAAGGAAIPGIYDVLCVCEYLRRRDGGGLPSRRALAILFSIDTAMNTMRVMAAMMLDAGQPVFRLPASQWFGWPAMLRIVCAACTSELQIAVAKEATQQRSNGVLAEARDTAKSRFLTRISHELRTPLNGIPGMAQTLTRDRGLHGVQRERAMLLEKSGRHLLAIINDVLDLASVETADTSADRGPAYLDAGMNGAVTKPIDSEELLGATVAFAPASECDKAHA